MRPKRVVWRTDRILKMVKLDFAGLDVYLVPDPDDAGQTAAPKIAALFVAEGLPSPKVVKLPPGQDVTDFFTGKKSKEPSANTPLAETLKGV